MTPAIQTAALTKSYGSNIALYPTTLTVPQGAVFALVGHNGAGKTTLIKVLMNIFQASSGECEVLETATRQLGPRQFAQIGYVSENQEMPGWMTVDYWLNFLAPFYPNNTTLANGAIVRAVFSPRPEFARARGVVGSLTTVDNPATLDELGIAAVVTTS